MSGGLTVKEKISAPKQSVGAKNIVIFVMMACTAVGITVSAICNKQNFIEIMPLYVSLVIALLQSRVNRYASLLGSFNSIVYAIVYFGFKIYGAALSALFFSFPIQLITFIRWNKNKSGNSTVLRKLGARKTVLLSVCCVASLAALWIILPLIGSDYVYLDGVTTLLGILVYFLTMFAYIEYPIFMVVNGLLNITLNAQMSRDNPSVLPHLIFAVYSLVCIVFAAFEARKLYESQQKEKAGMVNENEN